MTGTDDPEYKRVSLVLHRLAGIDPRYRRKLAFASRTKMKRGVEALTRTVLRLAAGEDVSPEMRDLLVKALSRGLQLKPGWPKQGQRSNPVWEERVARYIWERVHRHYPGVLMKTIYADAGKKFGLSASQARHIWRKRKRRFNRKKTDADFS
jgi:hypothetical protein